MKYLYFFGTWCGPCNQLSPIMNEVSQQIPVQKVDVDSEFELASQYNVRNVPTVVLLDNGQEVKRFVGVQPKETYLNVVK